MSGRETASGDGWRGRTGSVGRVTLGAAVVSLGALLAFAGVRRQIAARPPAIGRLAAALAVAEAPGPTLVAIFQPEDCVAYSALIDAWNQLHEEGRVRVVGIGLRFSGFEGDLLDRRPGPVPRFPVRYDLGGLAERAILDAGHGRTPVALLLDPAGRTRLAIPPVRDLRAGRELEELVRRYAELSLDD